MQKLQAGIQKPRYGRHDFYTRQKEAEEDSETPKVSLIIKADVDGSLEAILNVLETYDLHEEVRLDVVHFGVGEVTDTDLTLAAQFDGVVYAFNSAVSDARKRQAAAARVPVREYDIIYRLIDDLKEELSVKLAPVEVEETVGRGDVLQEFLINDGRKRVPVAGCRVKSGKFDKAKVFRVTRGDAVLYEGSLNSLKHLKDEVGEVSQGKECGLRVEDGEIRFEQGDVVECFETREEMRRTEWDPGF